MVAPPPLPQKSHRGPGPRTAKVETAGNITTPAITITDLEQTEEEPAVHGVPVAERHVAAEDIRRGHPREVDGVLRASERGRVAKLLLFQFPLHAG